MPNILYRIYNQSGDLLYVGATVNPSRRFSKHATYRPWWSEATEIRLEHFDTPEELNASEIAAIHQERPRYNEMHTNKPAVWARKPRSKRGGTIFQRSSDGLWVGGVELPSGPDGKRRTKRVYASTREGVELKLADLRRCAVESS